MKIKKGRGDTATVTLTPKDAVALAGILAHAVRGDISYDPPTRRAAQKILYQFAAYVEHADGDADCCLCNGGTLLDDKHRERLNAEYARVRTLFDPGYGDQGGVS